MKKIIRKQEVRIRTGLSYATLWRKQRAGTFPKPVKLGPNSVGWIESEVDDWIASLSRVPNPIAQPNVAAA